MLSLILFVSAGGVLSIGSGSMCGRSLQTLIGRLCCQMSSRTDSLQGQWSVCVQCAGLSSTSGVQWLDTLEMFRSEMCGIIERMFGQCQQCSVQFAIGWCRSAVSRWSVCLCGGRLYSSSSVSTFAPQTMWRWMLHWIFQLMSSSRRMSFWTATMCWWTLSTTRPMSSCEGL